MKFDELIEKLLEATKNISDKFTPKQLADQFISDVLKKYTYKISGHGHLHCGWTTKTFYNWALKKGIPSNDLKVIYFVWPEKDVVTQLKSNGILGKHYNDEGESHIAPIYKNQILDFTIGQFTGNENEHYRIVPLDIVRSNKSLYSKYGYGTNKFKGEHYIVGKYEDVVKKAEMQEPDSFSPPTKN
jgi:hypothetical protein